MFDTEKIQRLTALLKKMPDEFDNVYIIPDDIFTKETSALLKRLKIPVKAIMHDTLEQKEIFGLPVVKTSEATENFNERTALIIITKKSLQLIQTTFDFKVKGGTWTVPALVIVPNEILAIYDHIMIEKFRKLYDEDGLMEKDLMKLSERFARGIMTKLDPHYQTVKCQIWDQRWCFKPTYEFDDTAIVIQGPIVYDNNYTAETFKLYRSVYPNIPIVVSTWKNEATNAFRKECAEHSIILLENEPPKKTSYANIAMQLTSSLQGVLYVKKNTSAKFVLKTRTDQCINYFNFLAYFKNLLATFPPNGDKLHERIIFLGSAIEKKYPFHPHDFLSFGHVEDICKLYDISSADENSRIDYFLKHRKKIDRIIHKMRDILHEFDYDTVIKQNYKIRRFNKVMSLIYLPEIYLMRTFYEKYISPIDDTKLFETSWKFTVNYLILIDFNSIKLDWPKYESKRYKEEFLCDIQSNVFSRWLDMYRNFKTDRV